ncbi:MAG: hypothetical protein MK008_06730 [Bdellovibrionales bacterium]|nr:hypothetical protein [Bdellovibrionales bacterium]
MNWALEQDLTKMNINKNTIKNFEEKTGNDYPDYKYFGLHDLASYQGKDLKVSCFSEKNYCEMILYKLPEEKGALAKTSEFIVGVTKSGLCLIKDKYCESLKNTNEQKEKPVVIGALRLNQQELNKLKKLMAKHKDENGLFSLDTKTIGSVGGRKYTCEHISVYDDQPGTNSCYTQDLTLPGIQIVDDKTRSSVGLFDNTNPFMSKKVNKPKNQSATHQGIK